MLNGTPSRFPPGFCGLPRLNFFPFSFAFPRTGYSGVPFSCALNKAPTSVAGRKLFPPLYNYLLKFLLTGLHRVVPPFYPSRDAYVSPSFFFSFTGRRFLFSFPALFPIPRWPDISFPPRSPPLFRCNPVVPCCPFVTQGVSCCCLFPYFEPEGIQFLL